MEQRETRRSKPSRADTLEALDFIINVLKEHEKDLDRLINQLGLKLQQYSETSELTRKIESVENRLTNIQTQISDVAQFIFNPQEKRGPQDNSACQKKRSSKEP